MRVCPFKNVCPSENLYNTDTLPYKNFKYRFFGHNLMFWKGNIFFIYIWTFYNTDLFILRKLFYSKNWLQVSSPLNHCRLNPNFEFSASRMTNLTICKLSALFVWSSDIVYVQRYGACADLEIFRGISGGIVLLPWGPRPIFGNEYKLNRIKQVQLTHKIN